MIFSAIMSSGADTLWLGLLGTVIYSVIGIVLMTLSFLVIDALTPPGKLGQVIAAERFHPAVVVNMAAHLGIAIVMAAASTEPRGGVGLWTAASPGCGFHRSAAPCTITGGRDHPSVMPTPKNEVAYSLDQRGGWIDTRGNPRLARFAGQQVAAGRLVRLLRGIYAAPDHAADPSIALRACSTMTRMPSSPA